MFPIFEKYQTKEKLVDFNKINNGTSKTFFEVIDVPNETAKASAKLKIARS